jgi:hypothetical protein
MFPAIFYYAQYHGRDVQQPTEGFYVIPMWIIFLLFTYALLGTIAGLIGSIASLDMDWSQHQPFSCN